MTHFQTQGRRYIPTVSIFQFERVFVYETKVNPRRGLDTVYNPLHAKLSFSYYNSRILHDT